MLAGKTVLVTGASRGIGRAIAQKLLAERADVVLFACDGRALRQAVYIEAKGRKASCNQCLICVLHAASPSEEGESGMQSRENMKAYFRRLEPLNATQSNKL